MDKVKEGFKDLTNAPQRGAEEAENKGKDAKDTAKDKTQNRPGDQIKDKVDDQMDNLQSKGDKFMGTGK